MMRGVAGDSRNAVRLPLLLTAAIHLGALLLALAATKLTPEHPRIPEVYEVELYSATEAPPAPRPVPPAVQGVAKPPGDKPSPPPANPPPSTSRPPVTATVPASPPRPKEISLSPLKERLARENRERENEDRRRQLMEKIKLDLKKELAEKQLRESAREAREAIAETYRVAPASPGRSPGGSNLSPQGNVAATGTASASGAVSPTPGEMAARAAYVAQLKEHLRRNWKLPVLQDWDEKLNATVIIRIKRDGSVISTWFEKQSANPRFDRYVKAAVDRSSPLPPMPREFPQKGEEIAVTFTPGGLN